MNKRILFLLLLMASLSYSQKGFEDWDKYYIYKDALEIIQAELDYAKKIEKDTSQGHYYVALEKFRFLAKFTGKERNINKEVLNSMKRVFKVKTGNSSILNNLVSKELEFKIGNSKIWMPVQNQLVETLKEEVKKDKSVLLYCLFTNEHKFEGGIINSFLISEFTTEWK